MNSFRCFKSQQNNVHTPSADYFPLARYCCDGSKEVAPGCRGAENRNRIVSQIKQPTRMGFSVPLRYDTTEAVTGGGFGISGNGTAPEIEWGS
ncbi:hypothetical protein GCM10010136_33310 [Limoniibacter endophyticus]|uniref:Uncharacterized protein n=1 Tax=Limoniibacter endophyticus TaxID=1565040 RepID=A0A8J3GIW7_9HYPH|nr:hypothetical protein GCM10010136_33310 [Limoniibacter endophyticus]